MDTTTPASEEGTEINTETQYRIHYKNPDFGPVASIYALTEEDANQKATILRQRGWLVSTEKVTTTTTVKITKEEWTPQ